MRFKVFRAVLLKIPIFWDVTLCHWVNINRSFEESFCLHLEDLAAQKEQP